MQQAGQEGLALGQGLDRGRGAPRSVEKGKLRPALLRPNPGGKGRVGIGSGGMRAPSLWAGHGARALPYFPLIGPQSLLLTGPHNPQTSLSLPQRRGLGQRGQWTGSLGELGSSGWGPRCAEGWQPLRWSVPGSNDHRECHAPQGNSSRPKQPLPRDGLWIKRRKDWRVLKTDVLGFRYQHGLHRPLRKPLPDPAFSASYKTPTHASKLKPNVTPLGYLPFPSRRAITP